MTVRLRTLGRELEVPGVIVRQQDQTVAIDFRPTSGMAALELRTILQQVFRAELRDRIPTSGA